MIGYIKLHRCILENEFYFSERFTKTQAWIDLLLLATHNARVVYINGVEFNLEPGELCWSKRHLAERWKWNFKTLSKFLKSLEKHQMINLQTRNVSSLITIRNWEQYQSDGAQRGTQKVNSLDTNKNVKNDKKVLNSDSLDIFSKSKNNGVERGSIKHEDQNTVKSRLAYKPDPEKSRARLEELKQIFGDN